MTNFEKLLNRDGKEVLGARSKATGKIVEHAYKQIIAEKDEEIFNIELAIEELLDLGPETTDSLRPVDKGFDGKAFAQSMLDYRMSITLLKAERKVMQEELDNTFGKPTAVKFPRYTIDLSQGGQSLVDANVNQ